MSKYFKWVILSVLALLIVAMAVNAQAE